MRVLCPVYFVCMAVAVGSISAIAFYNLALFLIFLVELVILKWIVPLIQIALSDGNLEQSDGGGISF